MSPVVGQLLDDRVGEVDPRRDRGRPAVRLVGHGAMVPAAARAMSAIRPDGQRRTP